MVEKKRGKREREHVEKKKRRRGEAKKKKSDDVVNASLFRNEKTHPPYVKLAVLAASVTTRAHTIRSGHREAGLKASRVFSREVND